MFPFTSAYAHKVTASVEGSYDYVQVIISVNVSELTAVQGWKERLDQLYAYITSSRLAHEKFEIELESELNNELQKYVPAAHADNLDLFYGNFALYRKPANNTSLTITFNLHGVVKDKFLGPHILDLRFRRLAVRTEMELGATIFNPAEILHLDLTPFNTSIDRWSRISHIDRVTYQLVANRAKEAALEMLIILPPDTIFSLASQDTVAYWTAADIAEIFTLLLAVIIIIAVFIRIAKPKTKAPVRMPSDTTQRVFWTLWWAAIAIIVLIVSLGVWNLLHW
jgi:hypothetical protein